LTVLEPGVLERDALGDHRQDLDVGESLDRRGHCMHRRACGDQEVVH
jgi:hypothetical protein